jgi:protein TonB
MAPIAKENEILTAPTPAAPAAEPAGKTQAVALELQVSVNGARTVDGSDKREPFSESTKTVLVFGNGAVIRLTSPVAPGQLLFLTNEKTKKEVVCQVVKSKNYRNVSGYVELEFTEQVVGFWGVRFPSDRIGPQPAAASAPATPQVPVAVVTPKVTVPEAPKTDAAANFNALKALTTTLPATNAEHGAGMPASSLKPPVEAARVNPTASVPPPPASSDTSSEALKLEAARLQEELSSMLFAEKPAQPAVTEAAVAPQAVHETAAKILEFVKPEPPRPAVQTPVAPAGAESKKSTEPPVRLISASKNATSLLDEEEVKIPSWLEPLARNAAAASAAELPAVKEDQRQKEQTLFGGALVAESLADTAPPAAEADTRPFGSSFLATDEEVVAAPARSSNKGILIGTVAAGLLLAAAGLTWYVRNQSGEQQTTQRPAMTANAPVQAPVTGTAQGLSTASAAAPAATGSSSTAETSTPATTLASGNSASASMNNAVAKSPQSAAVPSATQVQVQPPAKKPALGEVRLAAPKVNGGGAKLSADEPGIALNGTEAAPTATLGEFAAGNSKQPVAPVEPLPVGGDVNPAKLLSSVSPVYPQLAKTQHVSGDVKVDALIDANGRVTTMKVIAGPTLLQQAAMDALRQWKYQPATLDGKPVPMHLTVTLQFRLQ